MTRTKKRTAWRLMFYEVHYDSGHGNHTKAHETPSAAIDHAKTLRANGHLAEVYKVQGWNG